mmetsp:Transcript_26074/g.60891  ORF Transcript_26074/g.60891 Transcript_26074/m.60891 type:complete len:148 (-) Transcript_26074:161-604(-)
MRTAGEGAAVLGGDLGGDEESAEARAVPAASPCGALALRVSLREGIARTSADVCSELHRSSSRRAAIRELMERGLTDAEGFDDERSSDAASGAACGAACGGAACAAARGAARAAALRLETACVLRGAIGCALVWIGTAGIASVRRGF